MIRQLDEKGFYDLKEGKDFGIFYYKSDWPRWFCVVMFPNTKPCRNVWNVEKLAFEWMDKFKKDFTNE